jgi:hypothetical protein
MDQWRAVMYLVMKEDDFWGAASQKAVIFIRVAVRT